MNITQKFIDKIKQMDFELSGIASYNKFKNTNDILIFTPYRKIYSFESLGIMEKSTYVTAVLSDNSLINLEFEDNWTDADEFNGAKVKEDASPVFEQLHGKDVKGLILNMRYKPYTQRRSEVTEYIPLPNGIKKPDMVITDKNGTVPNLYCRESDDFFFINENVALTEETSIELIEKLYEWLENRLQKMIIECGWSDK